MPTSPASEVHRPERASVGSQSTGPSMQNMSEYSLLYLVVVEDVVASQGALLSVADIPHLAVW